MGGNNSKPERTILLVGKTGDGKSSTGNLILKKQMFFSESSPTSSTKELVCGINVAYGRKIKVIDTPGLFGTSDDEEHIREKLIRSLVDCAPGPFVLTVVLKVGRYTKQEEKIEKTIWEYFGEIDVSQSLVLFTHSEDLDGQTIEEFVKKSPELQKLVDKCGGRCHIVDSKHWNNRKWGYRSNRVQMRKLLKTIDKMVMEKSGYTNTLLQIVEEEIQREINLGDPNLSQEERREKAKNTVFKKLAKRFTGVAIGTLVGALMGLTIPVRCLVALLIGVKNAYTDSRDAQEEKTSEADLLETASTCKLTEEVEEANETRVTEAAAAVVGATAAAAFGMEAGVAAAVRGKAFAATSAAAAGGAAAVGTAVSVIAPVMEAGGVTTAAVGAATVEAGIISGATAGAVAAEASVAAGAIAVEAGATGAGIGVAAGSGIAAGVILGAAALAGAIGGGVTGYKAVDDADSVWDAMKSAAKANYENANRVVKKTEELPTQIKNRFNQKK